MDPAGKIYVQLKLGKYTFNFCLKGLSSICACRKGCPTLTYPLLILLPTHIHACCRPEGIAMPAALCPDNSRLHLGLCICTGWFQLDNRHAVRGRLGEADLARDPDRL